MNTDYVSKVTFDSCGGSAVEERYIARDPAGSPFTCGFLPTPTRANYSFSGWFTDPVGGEKVDSNTTLTGNVTLYAHWSHPCTVTFDPQGGECKVTSVIREYGAAIGGLPIPVRAGYTFVAWYNAADSKRVYETTPVTGDMTLYATWERSKSNAGDSDKGKATGDSDKSKAAANTYKVKFNVNKGKALSKAKRFKLVKKGKAVGKLVKAKRPGYKFKGWFTKKKGGKKVNTKYRVKKNITLYAHWEKK
jgi:uncharacterized repeat protein (TIGR02543 family)